MRKMILLGLATVLFLGASFPGAAFAAKADKVDVCHNGHTINISANALPAHLAQGDTLGPCVPAAAVLALQANTPDPVVVTYLGPVTITVVNVGTAPTGLVAPTISVGFQIVSGDCGLSPLAPGASCSISVATINGIASSGSVIFTDPLSGSTVTATLSYVGPGGVIV